MNGHSAFEALREPLSARTRHSLRVTLSGLLAWQHRLDRFPRVRAAPNATPIVSVYAEGALRGCAASSEGMPRERVARAFLLALGDLRFGGIPSASRARVVGQIAFPIHLRRVSFDAAPRLIAPAAHGLALANGPGFPTLLVPEVAREHELDAEGLLAALEQKAGSARSLWPRGGLYVFETERVVSGPACGEPNRMSLLEAAVHWLSERVGSRGAVSFGLDPRMPHDTPTGPMLHGRAAVVVRALAAHASGRGAARRARRWLERELRHGLSGERRGEFPSDASAVAGTLALAKLAGIDVGDALRDAARNSSVASTPWHAGQVAYALGSATPPSLWRACVRSLDTEPRAPWIAMAAAVRQDWPVFERAARALAACVRAHGPHRGGVGSGSVPEAALTAVTVEALAPSREDAVRAAWRSARAFLEKSALRVDSIPEARDPRRIRGALPLSPINAFLRSDVTAHAVLALSAKAG